MPIYGREIISDRFVFEFIVDGHLWTDGDGFVCDGENLTIAAIRVKVVREPASIECETRVTFCSSERGTWESADNCEPESE